MQVKTTKCFEFDRQDIKEILKQHAQTISNLTSEEIKNTQITLRISSAYPNDRDGQDDVSATITIEMK